MLKVDELLLKCLELTKTDAYTRNTTMWCQAADSLYIFIKTKKEAEIEVLREMIKQTASVESGES
jgi:hypothetical protein